MFKFLATLLRFGTAWDTVTQWVDAAVTSASEYLGMAENIVRIGFGGVVGVVSFGAYVLISRGIKRARRSYRR